jgi:hypothetical protein
MAEQLLGAASAAVLVVTYLLVLQCMTAAALLLAQYIALQWRSLVALVNEPPSTVQGEAKDQGEPQPPVRLGGSLIRWD